jgi:hypothetical protein
MIQVEVAKAKVKEDILADLEDRKEGLRKIGEEVGVHNDVASQTIFQCAGTRCS